MIKEFIERKRAIVDACNSLELYPSEYAELENALNRIPAADVVEVRHGRWIEEDGIQICSECGAEHEWKAYRAPYCDTCGAEMNKDDGYCYLGELKEGADNE